MKRVFYVLIIPFICQCQLHAEKAPGYYITKSKDTMKVEFYIPTTKRFSKKPDYEKMQAYVTYYGEQGKAHTLLPDQVREISFEYLGVKDRMIASERNFGMYEGVFIAHGPVFLRLIKDGKLRLFKHYTKEKRARNYASGEGYGTAGQATGGPGITYSEEVDVKVENYIFQKDTSDFFQTKYRFSLIKRDQFKRDMSAYLFDCPILVKEIQAGKYRRWDIEKIVDEYNKTCSK